MNIKPSAAIRQNYNEISELCKTTKEPVFLTKNGEGDLVVMDINTFTRREKLLKLREECLALEEERLRGKKEYTIQDVSNMMRTTIEKEKSKSTMSLEANEDRLVLLDIYEKVLAAEEEYSIGKTMDALSSFKKLREKHGI